MQDAVGALKIKAGWVRRWYGAVMSGPILYSFRRCLYAMRARMALTIGGLDFNLREVKRSAKPQAMLQTSTKGTVPVLILPGGKVIDESLDIMRWALTRHGPEGWRDAAIMPFVRQFAALDSTWFAAQPLPHLRAWLAGYLASDLFEGVMVRSAPWSPP